ncbi:MAG: M23 family metallopeptidase, partial [Flavobacteriaceae bacterium]|nr:M23 family metallopeptidase [Flavobacteriaceae bacterium]
HDFVQLGENGKTHSGDGSKLTDYYAYGEPIFAIEDGIVEAVKDGEIESDSNLRQPDESDEDYSLRTAQQQQALLAKGFSNILGNYIILKHDNGEYSFYVHLKNGSVKVKNGEQVKRGQEIAALGHSGNSTEPHLHFHVTDSADLAYSRSLPVTFNNISLYPDGNGTIRHIHYGQIIISNN